MAFFTYDHITVSLSPEEIDTIISALGHDLFDKREIETHWVFHPDAMKEHKRHVTKLLRQFASHVGAYHRYEYYEDAAYEYLKECIKEKEKTSAKVGK